MIRVRELLCVGIGWILFQIIVALTTQYFGVFTRGIVVGANVVAVAVALVLWVLYLKKGKTPQTPQPPQTPSQLFKVNWFACAAFAIVFFELFSVHYFYTGIVSTINGFNAVSENSYQYPFFSDEYAGVAFTTYSIRTHSLPLADPLNADKPYSNLLVGFFSFTAELFLLFGANPLTAYVPLAIISGMLLCLLAYVFLRSREVDSFSASCAVLMLPLIINGGNLPGIWSFLPFIGGMIFLLAGLVLLEKKRISSLVSFFISLLLYPPIIVFVAPILLFMIIDASRMRNSRLTRQVVGITIAIAAIGLIALALTGTFSLALSLILRGNLVGGIPSFPLWIVIPWFCLPFAAVGIWVCLKKKMFFFLAPIAVGMAYWIAYAFTANVLIIDYPRIVTVTSFLIVMSSGFGIGFLIRKIPPNTYARWSLPLKIAIILVFIFMATSYPLESWARLVLRGQTPEGISIVSPASPVTSYLTADDLRLFSGITKTYFIAPSWKGLTVGAATNNYPLDSKPATLTESLYSYEDFVALDCVDKAGTAERLSIKYVYAGPFSCENFTLVGSSSEGLYLYKFTGYNVGTN